MKLPPNGKRIRIFIGESDKWRGKPLYEEIILLARMEGMAGATATRGIMGFGRNSRIHSAKILRLSEDLPVIVEIIDSEEKIDAFLSHLDPMVKDGLVTVEKTSVAIYRGEGVAA